MTFYRGVSVRVLTPIAVALALTAAGCGSQKTVKTVTITKTVTTTKPTWLPGTGRPGVAIGDKNFTEQFLLGELYYQALTAQGYSVSLNRNIGTTDVTMHALEQGTLSMYPEYLNTWNAHVAGYTRRFRSEAAAFRSGQGYALDHGYRLLNPSPFSDTGALATGFNFAGDNSLHSIRDLVKLDGSLIVGGPPQFDQDPTGLAALTHAYRFAPSAFKALNVGDQYPSLDNGTVQVAEVNTTDGQLLSGNYVLLSDPRKAFGWGNVVPVVPLNVLEAEGPQFAATINRVTALLTMSSMRQLNAAVDVSGEDPATVALAFLEAHGLVPPPEQQQP